MYTSICLLVIFGFTLVISTPLGYETVVHEEWEEFKSTHGKQYDNPETERFRLKVFMENKLKIAKHNQLADAGIKTYYLGMNHFGDLLHHEFVQMMNGYRPHLKNTNGSSFLEPTNIIVPKTVDWREKGYVTPVKDQGQCGSCWAFSSTGSLEGQHFRKTGKLVSLSEQNLVDCSGRYGNNGCGGGLMDNSFAYIKDNHGIDTEESYPYTAQDGTCKYNPANAGATDTGFVDIEQGSEKQLAVAVASVGPISVAIDASHESFQFYKSGVYVEPECSPNNLDHGVLVVGYGETGDGTQYWIVKNSWNTNWGDSGYIKMARNQNNQCGIASKASYPTV